MNKLKTLLIALVLIFSVNQLFAHAMYIETAASGKKGVAQDVKVFYGEPADGAPEKLADWWSDTKEFTLWAWSPSGEKTQLQVTAKDDHFVASFTPSADGVYTLTISHTVAQIAGNTQYQFNAAALVAVGKSEEGNQLLANKSELGVFVNAKDLLKKGKSISLSSQFKSAATEGVAVTVFSPAGWSKEVKTGAEGKASFTPEWSGRYILEASKAEKVQGKDFESIYRIATLGIGVN